MKIYLSHPLSNKTPTYGNRTRVAISKLKSIIEGSTVNESIINLPLHAGTHIDFPSHFFKEGVCHESFSADYWFFDNPLCVEINSKDLIINEELISKLELIENKDAHDLLLIKTGSTLNRNEDIYWESNFGLAPEVAIYLRNQFKNIRMVGFDFISLSSFKHSDIGKEAHLKFLNPDSPILVIEDMDLTLINKESIIDQVIIAPLRINNADGIPVSCMGIINEK